MNNRTVSFIVQNLTVPDADIPMPQGITGAVAVLLMLVHYCLQTQDPRSLIPIELIAGSFVCLKMRGLPRGQASHLLPQKREA